MSAHSYGSQDNKTHSVARGDAQKRSGETAPFQFTNNRSDAVAQRRLQEMANNSPRMTQLKALQQMMRQRQAHEAPRTPHDTANPPVQRMINVRMKENTDTRKVVTAKGDLARFADGTGAGDTGWVGVKKYMAKYRIENDEFRNTGKVGPLQNLFTRPEAGHILGRQNGGNGGDPENIFAQDGGSNNSTYKVFEGDMRGYLNAYVNDEEEDVEVEFTYVGEGDHIEEGDIAAATLAPASPMHY